jgi:hypothetical protein
MRLISSDVRNLNVGDLRYASSIPQVLVLAIQIWKLIQAVKIRDTISLAILTQKYRNGMRSSAGDSLDD